MDTVYLFDIHYLIPAALLGLAIAILLLILRRKKNGVRPPYARSFLIVAVILLVYAGVTIILIPLIHLIVLFFRFGTALFYSGLKSV